MTKKPVQDKSPSSKHPQEVSGKSICDSSLIAKEIREAIHTHPLHD